MASSPFIRILCAICSDESSGRYFGHYLCASCKAFFRRNADKQDKFICTFRNNCDINKITRRHCRKCRLDKCFTIGLKKEWIRPILIENKLDEATGDFQSFHNDPESVPGTSGYVAQNSKTTLTNECSKSGDDADDEEDNDDIEDIDHSKKNLNSIFESLLEDEVLHDLLEEDAEDGQMETGDDNQQSTMETDANTILKLSSQSYSIGISANPLATSSWDTCDSSCKFHQSHQEYFTSTSYITNCKNSVCSGNTKQPADNRDKPWRWKIHHLMLGINFMPISFRNEPISPRITLNHLEQEKLDELTDFAQSICNIITHEFPEDLNVPGFFKIIECCLQQLVPALNTVSTFSSLSMEDRMYLLKRAFADILLMRATVLIDIRTESFQIPKSPIVLQLKTLRPEANSAVNAFMVFIKSLRPNWRTDNKANMLVLAIMLFNPETKNISNPDIVRYHQFGYVYLLKRYLEFRCCVYCNAGCDFYDLMMKIGEFQETFNSRHIIHDLAMKNREAVGPLLSELLNFQ